MLVRSKEMVFREGRRFRVNPATGLTDAFNVEVPEGGKLSKHFVPAEGADKVEKVVKAAIPPGQASAPEKKGAPTKKQIMAELSAAGISFKATLSAVELQAILDKAKKKAAPAAAPAPAKELTDGNKGGEGNEGNETKGSGDQDVI